MAVNSQLAHLLPLTFVQTYVIIEDGPTLRYCPLNLTWQNQISRRNGLRALAFGLVLLGICVFAWGLRYKLSLYDPPHSVSHRMPAAKLLTGKEGIEVPSLDRYSSTSAAGTAICLTFTLAFAFFRIARKFSSASWSPAWLSSAPLPPLRVAPVSCWTRPPPRSF